MISNLSKIQQRFKTYHPVSNEQFSVKSTLAPHEAAAKQKIRQFWADSDIVAAKKLEGLNLDLSGFDPRRTSNKQMADLANILAEEGLIDSDLAHSLATMDLQLDAQGKPIGLDREINVYDFLNKQLVRLSGTAFKGNDVAKGELIEINASISVLMAIEEYSKKPRVKSLVNIRA